MWEHGKWDGREWDFIFQKNILNIRNISPKVNESSLHNRCKLSYFHLVWIHPHLFVVGCSYFLSCPFLTLRAPSKKDVVYQGVLQQSQEDKDKAAHEVHVYGLDIGNFGQGFPQVGVDGCHGEHRCNTWRRKTIFITLWMKWFESCIKQVSIALQTTYRKSMYVNKTPWFHHISNSNDQKPSLTLCTSLTKCVTVLKARDIFVINLKWGTK